MITREQAVEMLCRGIGRNDADFRDGQWEAIDGILNHRRQLVVQRTGWGKSMIYFLAARFLRMEGRGMTMLVSPLLALMRNQIAAAQRVGIVCDTINSTNREQWPEIEARVISGACDFLIVAPERFANEEFCVNVLDRIKNNIGLLVVDEAHCVSDWGHDFRPDYKKISNLLKGLPPNMPVLATTATANMRVVRDVEAQLGGHVDVSRGSLVRKSLFLQNIRLRTQEERLAWLAETLKDRIAGSGVVYALTIRDADRVARWLRMNGLSAYAYSSGAMPPEDMDVALREELEESEAWTTSTGGEARSNAYRMFLEDLLLKNRIRALVATSALSMGFDKPDLTFVIHYQRPKSVVDYYQQVGRAGRGVDFAYGILLNGDEDDEIAEYFIKSAFPKERDVTEMLRAIGESDEGLSVVELMARMNVRRGKLEQALKFVMSENPSPVVKVKSKYVATPFLSQYELPAENIQRLTDIRHQELARMDEYVRTGDCLMNFLCSELDSPADEPSCQRCGNCRPQEALPTDCDTSLAQKAAEFLNKSDLPITPRRQWADSATAATAFGIEAKKNIPAALTMEEGRALSVYGAGGLGRLVPQGKYRTTPPRFDDRLVEASAELLARWSPEKRPEWVTCIPSRRTPTLVPDFARRFAARLGLPFVECLRKVKDTPPQKEMENSSFQQNNLIGAFEIVGTPPAGVCLLVDDMVDSKWTLTIAAAMLLKAGAASVVPFALADSSGGE